MTTTWSYAELNAEHAANGLAFHVEALAFRGASLDELLKQACKGLAAPVAAAASPSSDLATVRPGNR